MTRDLIFNLVMLNNNTGQTTHSDSVMGYAALTEDAKKDTDDQKSAKYEIKTIRDACSKIGDIPLPPSPDLNLNKNKAINLQMQKWKLKTSVI